MPSSPVPVLRGKSHEAKIVWNPGEAAKFRMILGKLEGAEIEVTVRKRKKARSLSQNSYMWGVVYAMMAEAAGYTPEEMHDALKWEFLRVHGDSKLPTVRSTTELSTVEFEEYLSKCRMLALEMYGVFIPNPNDCEVA